jgi:hypothetical protein
MKPPKKPSKPLLKSEVRNADGSTTLVFRGGRVVTVPPDVGVWTPPARFPSEVREIVKNAFRESQKLPVFLSMFNGEESRESYKAGSVNDGSRVYWMVKGESQEVAWGNLEVKRDDHGAYLAALGVTVLPEHRGQRIYPRVLRCLREHYRLPVISGDPLSPLALLVWMSVGKWDRRRKRYAINPRSRISPYLQRRFDAALMLAFAEAASGDGMTR